MFATRNLPLSGFVFFGVFGTLWWFFLSVMARWAFHYVRGPKTP
jgi:hypothetical protein